MILAMPKLEQPCGRHVGRRRRGVDAHHAALQVIDAQHRLVEGAFKGAPAFRDGQVGEDRRQPVIGQSTRLHPAAEAPTEGALVCFAPRLDAIEPMVALGEDEGQPYDRRPAETQALPIAIGWEVGIQ